MSITNPPELPSRVCEFCGDNYTPWSQRQKFCSYDCRGRHWNQVTRERKAAEKAAKREAAEAAAAAQ